MKKSLMIIAATAAALAILFSCAKEEKTPEQNNATTPEETVVPGELTPGDGVFSLTLTAPQTRTCFGEGSGTPKVYPKKWMAGDVINVNGVNSQPLPAGDYNATATFTFTSDISAASYQVVYPASAYDAGTGKVTIPAAQTYSMGQFDPAADIILGYGTAPDAITLNNAVAYLKVRLTKGSYGNFGVKNIKVASSGKKLCGEFAIADGGLSLTVPASSANAAEETVTLSTGGQLLGNDAIEFLIAVAPQTCNIAVTVTDMKDNTQIKNKNGAELAKGGILAQNAFGFDEYHAIATPADLLAFADSCSAGNSNYWVITANIDMDGQTWPAAGTADDDSHSFKGTLDGGNKGDDTGFKISNLISTTGAFINYVGTGATIKNVTLASTCSISYSEAVSEDLHVGMLGLSHGSIDHCYNNAPISCSSSSYAAPLYIGGIVGKQEHTGPISYCTNNANITCSAKSGSTNYVYMGGIAGVVVCEDSSDTAIMSHCTNHGNISRGTLDAASAQSVHEIGGVIGWLKASNNHQHTHSYLVNDGDVSGPNYQTATNKIPQAVGGIIGGTHSDANFSGKVRVIIDHCTIENCQIQNLFRNNGSDGGTGGANYNYQCHNGGLIGIARGSGDVESVKLTNNTINNVVLFSTRGFAGGICGYSRGTTISNCNVISSQVSGAQVFRAGGITGCGYDVIIDNCTANLSKTSTISTESQTSSLYSGNVYEVGGIAGWITSTTGESPVTSQIKNCKAFVYHMRQKTVTAGTRGWIVGKCDGNATTIQDVKIGGTYYDGSSETITIDDDSDVTNDIIRGSSSTGVTISGTNGYWNGTL